MHVVASVLYAVLGAFQFSARTRRRHPSWHRRAGRVLVPLVLVVAASALWLTLLYDRKEGTGTLLFSVRLLVAAGMGACVLLDVAAVRRRDTAAHRAWMTRAYALALGARTQAFTLGFGRTVFGTGVVRTDLMMSAGWGVNLAVAELVLRRTTNPVPGDVSQPQGTRHPLRAVGGSLPGQTRTRTDPAASRPRAAAGRTAP